MAKSKTKSKSKTKAAKPEVDEAEDEDLELEELEDDESTDTPPKGGGDDVVFGAADLAKLLSKRTGKKISPRDLRTQLRRMARDGRIEREIVAGNRSRYSWSGPDDPEVKKIIKAVVGGELEEAKKAQLAALKERKAKKDKAKKKTKAKVEVEEEEDDDDEEEDED